MNSQRLCAKDNTNNPPQLTFISDLKQQDIIKFIESSSELCGKCFMNKKTHYCVQPTCQHQELICFNCEPNNIDSLHFLHQFTYVLPLFSKSIYQNFLDMKSHLLSFQLHVLEEIEKIRSYLVQMEALASATKDHLDFITRIYEKSGFEPFTEKIAAFSSQISCSKREKKKNIQLKEIFSNIKFYSVDQCLKIEDKITNDLYSEISKLKQITNPQKQLKLLLEMRGQQQYRDLFLSSRKKIQVSEIDNFFKTNNQFFTQNLKTHKVELKLENDFVNKSKFYEALVYHLKDVQRLTIENGHIHQIKTPLTFRNLKQLSFSCNTEAQPLILKVDNISDQLMSLKLTKLKEDDIKTVKSILNNCQNLKKLHLQFYNKYDLSSNKDLHEMFQAMPSSIENFKFKLRTESEVKKIYGYLSKFYKDSGQFSFIRNKGIQQFLKKCSLKEVIVEGVRHLNASQLLQKLENMPYLMNFKFSYDNVDLLTDVNNEKVKKLLKICTDRKRLMLGITLAQKQKLLPRRFLRAMFRDILYS